MTRLYVIAEKENPTHVLTGDKVNASGADASWPSINKGIPTSNALVEVEEKRFSHLVTIENKRSPGEALKTFKIEKDTYVLDAFSRVIEAQYPGCLDDLPQSERDRICATGMFENDEVSIALLNSNTVEYPIKGVAPFSNAIRHAQKDLQIALYDDEAVKSAFSLQPALARRFEAITFEQFVEDNAKHIVNYQVGTMVKREPLPEADVMFVKEVLAQHALTGKQKFDMVKVSLTKKGIELADSELDNLLDFGPDEFVYSPRKGDSHAEFVTMAPRYSLPSLANKCLEHLRTHNTQQAYDTVNKVIADRIAQSPNPVADSMTLIGYLKHYSEDDGVVNMGRSYFAAFAERQIELSEVGKDISLSDVAKQYGIDSYAAQVKEEVAYPRQREQAEKLYSLLSDARDELELPAMLLLTTRVFSQINDNVVCAHLAHNASLSFIQSRKENNVVSPPKPSIS